MNILYTNRLQLSPISAEDASFILKLINCPGFIRFIGDRQVRTILQAKQYIGNLLEDPNITYWKIIKSDTLEPIGVVTWLQREYLPAPDLGYALLPEFEGQGYAFEASKTWLSHQKIPNTPVLAICQAEHKSSIKLLLKLGFQREGLFEKDGKLMHQYSFDQ